MGTPITYGSNGWPWSAIQPGRRKVFVSHSHLHQAETDAFLDRWATRERLFISKALGVAQNSTFVDSKNPEYVMQRIREEYLEDSTVTIVLIGSCVHSRRYIDWEIKASLQQGEVLPNGLIGILLPSCGASAYLPERFAANWRSEDPSYGIYIGMPQTKEAFERHIEDAYARRTSRSSLISNPRDMMVRNAVCRVHGQTH